MRPLRLARMSCKNGQRCSILHEWVNGHLNQDDNSKHIAVIEHTDIHIGGEKESNLSGNLFDN